MLLILSAMAVLAPAVPCKAQRLTDSRRCVDKVFLREGLTLYGAILGRSSDGTLTMAVQREWLRSKSKKFYAEQTSSEDAAKNLETLRDRIRNWLQEVSQQKNRPDRPLSLPLQQYLREQLDTVDKKLAEVKKNPEASQSQFVLVELPADRVQRGYVQPDQKRKVALAAWKLKLDNVEERSSEDLMEELRERNVDPAKLDVDLSDRLPARADDERQWAARRAIVEHQFWESLEFQGTKDFLVETGRERPDLTKLLPELLNRELTRQLDDLLGTPGGSRKQETEPIAEATKTADENQYSSVVIMQLDQDLEQKWVSVETMLLAKMPGGDWQRVWSHVEKIDAGKRRQAIEDALADHEQVQQIRDAVQALGLPVAENQLTTAIRFGAATMEAQQNSRQALDAFVKRYVDELDEPPLILGAK
jgi:hypothetical protein